MKKILLTSSLLFCFANANVDSDLYKKALNSFENDNFQKSFEIFNKLAYENLDNSLINFYLGRSAYEIGNYEYALSIYERILFSEPNNSKVRLELAQTYIKLKLYDEALVEFESSLENKLSVELRKKVDSKIKYLKTMKQTHFVNTAFQVGLEYDSNVNSTSQIDSFSIYSPGLNGNVNINNDNKQNSATIFKFVAPISYKYKVEDDFVVNSTLIPLFMKYNNFKEKDLHLVSLDVSPTIYKKDYSYSFGFQYDLIYLGHEKYQDNYYFKPKYTKMFGSNLLNTTILKMGKINYSSEKQRSSNHYSLTNNLKYATQNTGVFDFKFQLGKESKLYSERTDVSRKFYSLGISNSYNIYSDAILKSSIDYKKTDYLDTDVNYQSEKEYKKYSYSLNLRKPISEDISANFGGKIIDNKSNQSYYEYDKYIINANVTYSF